MGDGMVMGCLSLQRFQALPSPVPFPASARAPSQAFFGRPIATSRLGCRGRQQKRAVIDRRIIRRNVGCCSVDCLCEPCSSEANTARRHKEHTHIRLLFLSLQNKESRGYPPSDFSRHSTALVLTLVRLAARFCGSATLCLKPTSTPLPLCEATGQQQGSFCMPRF